MQPTPRPVIWYRWFCLASVAVNLILAWACAISPDYGPDLLPQAPGVVWQVMPKYLVPMGVTLALINLGLFFLRPTPLAYACHVANLALTACGCVLAPICAPMVLAFRSAEVQSYFGVRN